MAAVVEKPYYQFIKGINTEGSLIAFPEGFSADEENYDLEIDGSRRRRKGLALETGGSHLALSSVGSSSITAVVDGMVGLDPRRTITTSSTHGFTTGDTVTISGVIGTGTYDIDGTWEILGTPSTTSFYIIGSGDPSGSYTSGGFAIVEDLNAKACHSFKWQVVDGDPTLNFLILQVGKDLYIYNDTGTVLSTQKLATSVNLGGFKVSGATDDDVRTSFVDISHGDGKAFVVGKYIQPFYISYDPDSESFSVTDIYIYERDFEGIDDGVAMSATPTVNSASHAYNLQNRGWTQQYITDFFTSKGYYPSKSMIPYLGLKRTLTGASSYDADGVRVFSPDKLVAELFQDASAPQGHFVKSPFDGSRIGGGATLAIGSWSTTGYTSGLQTITVNTDGNHGLSVSDSVTIAGHSANGTYDVLGYGPMDLPFSIDGVHTVLTVPDANTFTVEITYPSLYDHLLNTPFDVTLGSVIITDVDGDATISPYRPTCTAFFSGRVWYAGTPFKRLAGRLYFSQIIEAEAQYGKCYQVADPTDERISDIVPSDGGVIVIPEVGQIVKLLPYGNSLLVFASAGVWQIGPGAGGLFTATSYSIRKITDIGCVSGPSVVVANNVPYYCAASDIFVIVEDTNSGLLVSQNLTEATIHSLYASAKNKHLIQGEYDEVERRIVWLYTHDSDTPQFSYDKAFCFNTLLGAFTKYGFAYDVDGYVTGLTSMREPDSSDKKLKFISITGSGSILTVAETNSTDFLDFGDNEREAYIISGPEVLGDASKHKHAPYVWVFSKRTETGYTTNDDGSFSPVNDSSTKLQVRWDWADLSVNGKWSPVHEAYRHRRLYIPSTAEETFTDGAPLVVTRNRVRGRGRAMQVKLTAGTGKDSYIAGWHVRHDVHTES